MNNWNRRDVITAGAAMGLLACVPAIDAAFEPIATADLAVKGDSASLVFATPGDFPYFCSLHGTARNGQTARIIVVP